MNKYLKNMVEDILELKDDEDLGAFAAWAFGERYIELNGGLDFMEAWNMLHQEDLKLTPCGWIDHDVKTMFKLYKDRK